MLVIDDSVKVPPSPLRLPVAVMSTTCVPGVRVLASIVSGKSPTYNTGGTEKAILIKGTVFLLGKLKLERTMQCHLATVASYKLRLSLDVAPWRTVKCCSAFHIRRTLSTTYFNHITAHNQVLHMISSCCVDSTRTVIAMNYEYWESPNNFIHVPPGISSQLSSWDKSWGGKTCHRFGGN